MISTSIRGNAWRASFRRINEDIFNFTTVKPGVDVWIEENMRLPESTTAYPGPYDFNLTPWMRKIVNHLHPKDPTRYISIMKDGQSGFTTALVIGGLLYIIAEMPTGILFTAADINLAKKTIEERFDPVIRESRLEHLIRPNVIKKTNNRTGDTSLKKEFVNGTLTTAGTNSANTFRMFSAQIIINDDYDTAPKEIGKEGSPKMVMKTRQNSYGDKAKSIMISTPTVTQTSNIWEQVQLGTENKWHWPCPACEQFFAVEFQIRLPDGAIAGIVWELDEHKKLIPDSIRFKCPHCGHLIEEKEKYDLNLKADWFPTNPNPAERLHESYYKEAVYNPPGFDGWRTLVEEWLAANPPGEKPILKLLKTFTNLRRGLPFEETGETPRVNDLMLNTRNYLPGVIPDVTSERDGNGRIIFISLACDLNGIMNQETEDVRLDWEILAHTTRGVTYSVDHGSIGSFKRARDRKSDVGGRKADDDDRIKWTFTHRAKNNVWTRVDNDDDKTVDKLEDVISKIYPSESGHEYSIHTTVVDTGFFEKLAMLFIKEMFEKNYYIYGVKGRVEENFRKLQRDSNPVVRSRENPKHLYIVEVNQMKDDLSNMMKLREGEDGSQPSGFMNFPESRDGKYNMKNYFSHYEGERRVEVMGKNGEVIGYQWVKKNSQSQNHFWDVRIYNLAAPLVFLDIVKQSEPAKYKNITWEDFVLLIE